MFARPAPSARAFRNLAARAAAGVEAEYDMAPTSGHRGPNEVWWRCPRTVRAARSRPLLGWGRPVGAGTGPGLGFGGAGGTAVGRRTGGAGPHPRGRAGAGAGPSG